MNPTAPVTGVNSAKIQQKITGSCLGVVFFFRWRMIRGSSLRQQFQLIILSLNKTGTPSNAISLRKMRLIIYQLRKGFQLLSTPRRADARFSHPYYLILIPKTFILRHNIWPANKGEVLLTTYRMLRAHNAFLVQTNPPQTMAAAGGQRRTCPACICGSVLRSGAARRLEIPPPAARWFVRLSHVLFVMHTSVSHCQGEGHQK